MAEAKGPPPQMRVSQAKLDYHIKQLRKYFARADDRAFLQMIWAADALQSDREAAAKKFMPSYPKEAAVKSSLLSPYGIHRWELETLLIQLLLTPKEERRAEGNFDLDCSKFDAIRDTINRLRSLENVESGRYAKAAPETPSATATIKSLRILILLWRILFTLCRRLSLAMNPACPV
jgi:hypothetical protein